MIDDVIEKIDEMKGDVLKWTFIFCMGSVVINIITLSIVCSALVNFLKK